MMTAVLLLGILLFLALQVLEVRRRLREPDTLTQAQFRRRILTAAAFQAVLLLWLVGEPLTDRQPPMVRLAYWTGTLLLAIGASFSAAREMVEVSRQYHRQRADLFRREVEPRSDDRSRPNRRGASTGNGRSA